MSDRMTLYDVSLVIAGGVQAIRGIAKITFVDIPTTILDSLIEEPINTALGLATLYLIIERIKRIRQKRRITKNELG